MLKSVPGPGYLVFFYIYSTVFEVCCIIHGQEAPPSSVAIVSASGNERRSNQYAKTRSANPGLINRRAEADESDVVEVCCRPPSLLAVVFFLRIRRISIPPTPPSIPIRFLFFG